MTDLNLTHFACCGVDCFACADYQANVCLAVVGLLG